MRRGAFTLVVLRQQAAGGKILRSGLLGPCSPALSSNGHRRKRWSDRGVARKRRPDRAVILGATFCGVLAAPYDLLRGGCHGSSYSRSSLDRGRSFGSHGPGGSERAFGVTAKAGHLDRKRESDARECVRASEVQLQKSSSGSLTQRSARQRLA